MELTPISVILATTPGFPRGKEWPLCRLHESIGNVNIYAYEAWSSINDEFSWDSLLNYGNNLVDILAKRDNSSTAAEVYVFFFPMPDRRSLKSLRMPP